MKYLVVGLVVFCACSPGDSSPLEVSYDSVSGSCATATRGKKKKAKKEARALAIEACASSCFGVCAAVDEGCVEDDAGATSCTACGVCSAAGSVKLYQSVEIPLMIAGEPDPTPNAPVLEGRETLIRVLPAPGVEWRDREVEATLETARGAQTASSRRGAIEFLIPAAEVAADLGIAVSIAGLRWPAEGLRAISTSGSRGPLRIRAFGLKYVAASGEERLADMRATTIESIRRTLFSMFPVDEVIIDVDSRQLPYSGPNSSQNMGRVLAELWSLRAADNPPANVFYVGMWASSPEACPPGSFCPLGGIAYYGGHPSWADRRVSLIAEGAGTVAAHELGHNFDRRHVAGPPDPAPGCAGAPADPDPNYPHAGASIGNFGRDPVTGVLLSPEYYRDVMSYCFPQWVSDYTHRALHAWINAVNASSAPSLASAQARFEPSAWILAAVENGRATRVKEVVLDFQPSGRALELEVIDGAGVRIDRLWAYALPIDEGEGSTILFPRPGDEALEIRAISEGWSLRLQ